MKELMKKRGQEIVRRGQRTAKNVTWTGLTCLAALLIALSLPGFAHAQTSATPTPDTSSFIQYSTLANQGKGEVNNAMSSTAPVVMAIVIGMICFGLLIAWIRRSPKNA